MKRFEASHEPGKSIMTNDSLRAVVQTLDNGVRSVEAPLQRLEHSWHMPVAYLIIPIFPMRVFHCSWTHWGKPLVTRSC